MPKRRQPRDPFADYIEWSNNRYNPGHFLGGNIPPHMRMSRLGPRALRSAAVLQMISAALAIGLLMVSVLAGVGFSRLEWLLSGGFAALVIWAGATMYRRSRRSSPGLQRPVRRTRIKSRSERDTP